MFPKKNHIQENSVLPELHSLMENAEFGRELAKQGLHRIFELIGPDVDCVVFLGLMDQDDFLVSSLPEDEAQFYRKLDKRYRPESRIDGRKSLYFTLEIENFLSGLWVFEVPEQTSQENIIEYGDVVSVMKGFVYSCFLSEAYEERKNRDCFTNLLGITAFDMDIHKALKEQEQGFLLVGRCPAGFSGSCQENGLNFYIINMAEICRNLHPDRLYRIGPDMVAMICTEEKEEVFSVLQELMHMLSDHTFFLVPLSVLGEDNIYSRIQKEMERPDGREFIVGCEGIYPRLTAFREENL